jgi:ribose-phosphate pyrophosphokinase
MSQPKEPTPLLMLLLGTPGYVTEPETKPYRILPLRYQRGNFPGGEVFFRLDHPDYVTGKPVLVTARLRSSDDVMALLMATDALRRLYPASLTLKLFYLPYGRQDRVAVEGESLSVAVMGELLKNLPYESIFVLEPHSDGSAIALGPKATMLTNNSVGYAQFVRHSLLEQGLTPDKVVLVSPDAGAAKRQVRMSQDLQLFDVAEGKKHRDLETNRLTGFGVDREDFQGKVALIVDDLCDGGGTFVGLAKVLRERGASAVHLMVTHGLFPKGLAIFQGLIDVVYSTNSYRDFDDLAPVEGVRFLAYKLQLF